MQGTRRDEREHHAIVGDGLVTLALVLVGTAALLEGEGMLRVQADDVIEIRNRPVELAALLVDAAAAEITQGLVRLPG